MAEAITEDSSVGDTLEDVTDSDLETCILIKEPDSAIENFVQVFLTLKMRVR